MRVLVGVLLGAMVFVYVTVIVRVGVLVATTAGVHVDAERSDIVQSSTSHAIT